MADKMLTSDGCHIHYKTCGNGGAAIFCLSGVGGSTDSWCGFMEAFDLGRYTLVCPDYRGHGSSEGDASDITFERLGRDVLELADMLGINRFIIIGHSFGAKLAHYIWLVASSRVTALIFIGIPSIRRVPPPPQLIDNFVNAAGTADGLRAFLSPLARNRAVDGLFDIWINYISRTPADVLRAVCVLSFESGFSGEPSEALPVLIIVGQHDPLYGPEFQREYNIPVWPQASFVTMDAGHGLIVECPRHIAYECDIFLVKNKVSVGSL